MGFEVFVELLEQSFPNCRDRLLVSLLLFHDLILHQIDEEKRNDRGYWSENANDQMKVVDFARNTDR